jgi:hypothetical protein
VQTSNYVHGLTMILILTSCVLEHESIVKNIFMNFATCKFIHKIELNFFKSRTWNKIINKNQNNYVNIRTSLKIKTRNQVFSSSKLVTCKLINI